MGRRVLEQDDAGRHLDVRPDQFEDRPSSRPVRLPVDQCGLDVGEAAQGVEVVLLVVIERRLVAQPPPDGTIPASPYLLSLAMRTASSSSSNGMTTRTGPKISSWAIVIELSTSTNIVGSTYQPFGRSAGRPPPRASVAPSALPFSM